MWQSAGFTGSGVKVGILDTGFNSYQIMQLLGELPGTLQTRWSPLIGNEGLSAHGTACAEIVYDIAPNAEFYLANSSGVDDLEGAIDWLITQGVDVVTSSIGGVLSSPGDGSGEFCDLVNSAHAQGITWAQAVGNFGNKHYFGTFNPDSVTGTET
jgi:hypothetical protein